MSVKITGVELRRVNLPYVTPWRTSFGTQAARDALLVRIFTPEAEGWGECVAMRDPVYSSEYTDGAHQVIREHLLPRLLERAASAFQAAEVVPLLAGIKGHRMAKAVLEMAVLDAELRAQGKSFAEHLGSVRSRVEAGVAVGIAGSIAELLDTVATRLDEGYRFVKLKIEPGWDVEPVWAVRERFGEALQLQVDANAAYTLADAPHLAALDPFDLNFIEQPLPEEEVLSHAELAKQIRTPICLDESIISAQSAADAIALGACSVVSIKAGRVGGYLEALRAHDVCADAEVPAWYGGMLETGIGRAANLALAALPNFTLAGDLSASSRYFQQDIITKPFVMEDGRFAVPDGPGIGVDVDIDLVDACTTSVEQITP